MAATEIEEESTRLSQLTKSRELKTEFAKYD